MTAFQPFTEKSIAACGNYPPALFTSTSTRPKCAQAVSSIAAAALGSRMESGCTSTALEVRRFVDTQANESPDDHQRRTGEERGGPNCHSKREADLHDASIEATAMRGRVFNCHQHGAAPLATHRNALHRAACDQQNRRGDSDGFVCG
jgi:hypothetical protein